MRRSLCTAPDKDTPIRLYRFQQIKILRALLRVKVLQLGAGVCVFLPSASIISNGGLPSLAEGSLVAAVVGGTIVAGSTMSWYTERIVGEMAWLPARNSLRVSTLTMWGDRRDVDLTVDKLKEDGLSIPAPALDDEIGEYPTPGPVPIELCGKTYICIWGEQHVQEPEAMARLLKRDELPFDPDGVVAAVSRPARQPLPPPREKKREDDIRFF